MRNGKAQVQETGGHAAENQKQIQTNGWRIKVILDQSKRSFTS